MDADPLPQCDFRAEEPVLCAGYAYSKGEQRTEIIDRRARRSYGYRKLLEEWEVPIRPSSYRTSGLAADLEAAWNAPGLTMPRRQRLLRALVTDIIADVDEAAHEVIPTIHWRGGQHSQLRIRKPKSGSMDAAR
jgi:hypothetical protein